MPTPWLQSETPLNIQSPHGMGAHLFCKCTVVCFSSCSVCFPTSSWLSFQCVPLSQFLGSKPRAGPMTNFAYFKSLLSEWILLYPYAQNVQWSTSLSLVTISGNEVHLKNIVNLLLSHFLKESIHSFLRGSTEQLVPLLAFHVALAVMSPPSDPVSTLLAYCYLPLHWPFRY